VNDHMPAPPLEPEPPKELLRLAESLAHPAVTRIGLTTTERGEWALMVRVPPGTALPLPDLEERCRPFSVVYQYEPQEPPVARPAYPSRGE
jgi:hypothetical protein